MDSYDHVVFKTAEGHFYGVSKRVISLGYRPDAGVVRATEDETKAFIDNWSARIQPTAEQTALCESTTGKQVVIPESEPEPVIPEPVIPEPVIPEPVIPEPVIPEPVIPEPVIPGPTMEELNPGSGWTVAPKVQIADEVTEES